MLGYLCRSNMLGTQFTIFDNGHSPKSRTRNADDNGARRELVAVVYVSISFHLLWVAMISY